MGCCSGVGPDAETLKWGLMKVLGYQCNHSGQIGPSFHSTSSSACSLASAEGMRICSGAADLPAVSYPCSRNDAVQAPVQLCPHGTENEQQSTVVLPAQDSSEQSQQLVK